MNIRVYYEDTDAGGIVYHANYLKFCERARSELYFKQGSSPQRGAHHFVIRNVNASFKSSAKLGDLLTIKTSLNSVNKVSLSLHQEVYLEDKLLFEMDGEFVLVNQRGKITRLNSEDVEVFTQLSQTRNG